MQKALFLDRDGIINIDHGYVHKIEEFDFVDGIFTLCQKAQQLDYKIFVITNQAGIARGYYTIADFQKLTKWMVEQFAEQKVEITDVYFCPHHPDKGVNEYVQVCHCRKPEPGMIIKAQKEHQIDLVNSVFVGDKGSDMAAAYNAGIKKRFLVTSQYQDDEAITSVKVESITDVLAHL